MDIEDKNQKEETIRGLASDYVALNSKIHSDFNFEIIFTTDDKIKLCLYKYISSIETRNSWQAPLGIFLTIMATFSTTEFKKFILPANTWESIFIIIGFVSFVWLIRALKQLHSSMSIEDIVNEIKKPSGKHFEK